MFNSDGSKINLAVGDHMLQKTLWDLCYTRVSIQISKVRNWIEICTVNNEVEEVIIEYPVNLDNIAYMMNMFRYYEV